MAVQTKLPAVLSVAPVSIVRSNPARSPSARHAAIRGYPIDCQAAESIHAGRITTCTADKAANAPEPNRPTTAKL